MNRLNMTIMTKNDLQKSEGSNSTPFENHALPIPQIINL
jgi:hypothetical protein